jgi:hypothetical protein
VAQHSTYFKSHTIVDSRVKSALRAASLHLLASSAIATGIAFLVFWLWFPFPYRELVGGRSLFLLIIGVDVICGPALTAIVFNPRKPRRELIQDLSLVMILQLAALIYGLFTLSQARPVYTVFETDRFRVITAADISPEKLQPRQGGLQVLPWMGPRIIGTRTPQGGQEFLESLDLSLAGIDPSMRPDWWQPYEMSKAAVLERAKKVELLRNKHPTQHQLIDQAIRDSGLSEQYLAWLPLTSFRSLEWVAFIDSRTAEIKSFAPVDGF